MNPEIKLKHSTEKEKKSSCKKGKFYVIFLVHDNENMTNKTQRTDLLAPG